LVTLAIPESLHAPLAGQFPEATWLLLPEASGGIAENAAGMVLKNLDKVTSILVGPGFGLRETTRGFIAALLARQGKNSLPPVVMDADGLKLLSGIPDWASLLPSPAVLTPHPGEMAILTGLSTGAIQQSRVKVAEEYAQLWGHVVVLKGAFTVVAAPDGRTAIIPVASPALARAGTGDVLAGVITGLRAQGLDAFQSATAGAWIHAQAGLRAAKRIRSTAAVLAGDVLNGLIEVMGEVTD
jgi:NAD(P)H-hydrate epimerase